MIVVAYDDQLADAAFAAQLSQCRAEQTSARTTSSAAMISIIARPTRRAKCPTNPTELGAARDALASGPTGADHRPMPPAGVASTSFDSVHLRSSACYETPLGQMASVLPSAERARANVAVRQRASEDIWSPGHVRRCLG